MNSKERLQKLSWLASGTDPQGCRILTNARCLAEGVDVPSLDAVIFFSPRKSEVDVVQAVGRVMRTFHDERTGEDKKLGYIILPVFIPAGMQPEDALNDSKTFDVVWKVLQALRSHDERLEARVNSLQLTKKKDKGTGHGTGTVGRGGGEGEGGGEGTGGTQTVLDLSGSEELVDAVYAKLVSKVGTRIYWDTWADDVSRIAQRHVEQINAAVASDPVARDGMDRFLKGLRESLNPGIKESEAVEMVAQHMITLPVFDALFGDFEFAQSNPVSVAIEGFLSSLEGHGIGEMDASDKASLDDLYASVRRRASMVRSDAGRQELIKNLYEEFFSNGFKCSSEKLGIVYTPNEVVEFMLRFTDRLLQREFGKRLADSGVHTIDAFAGTGTFMARLIEDEELMPLEALRFKYRHELHSNEILLLAYYIMVVNVEYAYHSRTGEYAPYELAVLADTFQMYEGGNTLDDDFFQDNTLMQLSQKRKKVLVCVSNPPYSAGQTNANDDNANEHYPDLENRIRATYSANTTATNKNSLMDSYIKAFRWASDRIGDKGIVAYVTNAGWLRSDAGAGVRRCFAEEFNSIYVYDLRGNQRTQGEQSRREGGKVFGSGSRAPIAVTVLVKNPASAEHGVIRYFDVGDYKTREEKLEAISQAAAEEPEWIIIRPDRHGDWLDQRDESWYELAPMGVQDGTKKTTLGMWTIWSSGLKTQRDAWTWGYSREAVEENVSRLVRNTNEIIERTGEPTSKDYESTRYSWSSAMLARAKARRTISFDAEHSVVGSYRPYCKQWLYYDAALNERTYQQNRLFPLKAPHETFENVVIVASGMNAPYPFSFLAYNKIPSLTPHGGNGSCFPLYWYEKVDDSDKLFVERHEGDKQVRDAWGNRYVRHDAVTDHALQVFRDAYPMAFATRAKKDGGTELSKEDLFYYVYGVLHSTDYRERYAANLAKELPRVPLVELKDFEAFSAAGRELAKLHLGYEDVEPWPNLEYSQLPGMDPGRVTKLAWKKRRDPETKKMVADHTALVYNANLTISNIPERAQRYVVNGRSPLDWMIDRYQVKTDKNTGITNDPNEYSDDPLYIVKLIGSLVTVSMRTLEIVESLPPIREIEKPASWPEAWKPKA